MQQLFHKIMLHVVTGDLELMGMDGYSDYSLAIREALKAKKVNSVKKVETSRTSLQANARALEHRQRMDQLNRGLQARPTQDELKDANILRFNAALAQGLQPNAAELERNLAQQLSKGYLQSAGILQYNENMANRLQPTANALNAQLLDRPKTVPGYYSDSLAPTLHQFCF